MKPIFLVGEAKGEAEVKIGSSFVGPSGVELLRMLNESDLIEFTAFDRDYISEYFRTGDPRQLDAVWSLHPEVFRTNVFQQHPPRNQLEHFCGPKTEGIAGFPALLTSKYVRKEFEHELDRLAAEIMHADPNLIICFGDSALWALAGRTGITKFRGTTLLSTHTASGFKLISTYHPADILRRWELRPTAIADLIKAEREAKFPEIRRPKREIWIEPTIDDIDLFFREYILDDCLLSVDIETSGSRITCIGFAPSPSLGIVIPFDDSRSKSGSYWPTQADERRCWELIRNLLVCRLPRKLFQNGAYDIAFLWRAYGIGVRGAEEDTMLLHHALHPESLKGLGYLGSVYADEGAWKHMRTKTETLKRDN